MAWEWVAPVATASSGMAGVFFTWLTGHQSRRQIRGMTENADMRERTTRLGEERRNAYLSALRLFRLELVRDRYRNIDHSDEQGDVEAIWPKADQVKMTTETAIVVDAFGSQAARHYMQQWIDVGDDVELRRATYSRFLDVVREEFGEYLLPRSQ